MIRFDNYEILIIFLTGFLLFSCGNNKQVEQELSIATRLLRIEPDSSLRIIENIDPDRILRRSTRAKYALLYSAALDKNYVDADDDSLIRIAYRYYDNRICSDSVKFLINYHYGRIYQNGDDYQEAMRYYLTAENTLSRRIRIIIWVWYTPASGRSIPSR